MVAMIKQIPIPILQICAVPESKENGAQMSHNVTSNYPAEPLFMTAMMQETEQMCLPLTKIFRDCVRPQLCKVIEPSTPRFAQLYTLQADVYGIVFPLSSLLWRQQWTTANLCLPWNPRWSSASQKCCE